MTFGTSSTAGCAANIEYTLLTSANGLCAPSGAYAQIVYSGQPCDEPNGNQVQSILWTSMYNDGTIIRAHLSPTHPWPWGGPCNWTSAAHDANWIASYTGDCGVAPTMVPELPTTCSVREACTATACTAATHVLKVDLTDLYCSGAACIEGGVDQATCCDLRPAAFLAYCYSILFIQQRVARALRILRQHRSRCS